MNCRKRHVFVLFVIIFTFGIILQIHTRRRSLSNKSTRVMEPVSTTTVTKSKNIFIRATSVRSTGRSIKTRNFTEMPFGQVYVFGAALGNSSSDKTRDLIKVYAMMNAHIYRTSEVVKYCLVYKYHNSTRVFERSPRSIQNYYVVADIMSFHVTCSNIRYSLNKRPYTVGLTVDRIPCEKENFLYVKPILPLKEPGVKLALGTKLAYLNISAEMIIEWMETYKYLGVDKIITYYYKDINENALKVLKYYHDSKFLDLYYFIPAAEDIRPRQFHDASFQTFNDMSMVVYDSFERMSGYTYFGIIDFDEFLIPSKDRSLKKMLADLHQNYKNAAGFIFKSQYYYLSWGPFGNMNDLIIGSYINRTDLVPYVDRRKLIYMPKYIAPGGAHTHGIDLRKGLKKIVAPSSDGFIRHFRKCRTVLSTELYSCMNQIKRVSDRSIANWSMRIKNKVHYVRKQWIIKQDYKSLETGASLGMVMPIGSDNTSTLSSIESVLLAQI